MSFGSDNWAGASPRVMEVLAEANSELAPAYGNDHWTGRARDILSDQFEKDVAAFFVGTGSAANSLALGAFARPGGIVIAHTDAHLARDEAGAPLLFSPGMQIDVIDGPEGRICPKALAARLKNYGERDVHRGRPVAVSITNVNEIGQCYSTADVAEIAAIARRRGCATLGELRIAEMRLEVRARPLRFPGNPRWSGTVRLLSPPLFAGYRAAAFRTRAIAP